MPSFKLSKVMVKIFLRTFLIKKNYNKKIKVKKWPTRKENEIDKNRKKYSITHAPTHFSVTHPVILSSYPLPSPTQPFIHSSNHPLAHLLVIEEMRNSVAASWLGLEST